MEAVEEISFVSTHDEYGDEGGLPYSVKLFDGRYYRVLPPDSFELMQFTGLRDRNGKEIYEGDLLRCSDGTGRGWVTRVQFDGEVGGYHRFADYHSGEVVGNIFENPELLRPID